MKILSILEIRQQNKQLLVDEDGNPVLDRNGNEQYVMPPRASMWAYEDVDFDYQQWINDGKKGATPLSKMSSSHKAKSLTLESYARDTGAIFDSEWGQYSYEEILAMEENGVVIPQDIIDWAHSMENSDPSAFLDETQEELNGNETDPAEKDDSFVAFKAKATKAIEDCGTKSEETKKSLEDLNRMQSELERIQEETKDTQLESLDEMKKATQDWDKLQKKVKDGKTLNPSEQSRMKELEQIFKEDDKSLENKMKQDIRIMEDISVSLGEKNELAIDSKFSGDQAVEISESFDNFDLKDRATQTQFSRAFGVPGILGYLIGVSMAKDLAQKTMKTGTETQIFSEDTQLDLNTVASIMDLEISVGTADTSTDALVKEGRESVTEEKPTETMPTEGEAQGPQKPEESQSGGDTTETTPTQEVVSSTSGTSTADSTEAGEDSEMATGTESPSKSTTKSSKSKKEKNQDPGAAQGAVDGVKAETKKDHKESEQINKETKRTTKQLKAETKKLQKRMNKDTKLIKKMTKESIAAAKKQQEMLIEYDALTVENEQIAAKQEQKKSQVPNAQPQEQAQATPQNEAQGGQSSQIQAFGMSVGSAQNAGQTGDTGSENDVATFEQNSQRIDQLGVGFKKLGVKITRNSVKMKKLQKVNNKRLKSFNKKSKTIDKQVKAEEKAEETKAKKLQKQLGVVGVASNIFSITTSVGTIMMMIPYTASAGAILVGIGNYGTAACGVTKTTILMANGMLSQGLISLATTAATVAMSVVGAGAAEESVIGAVSEGAQVVSSSVELVNNVRTLQGKETSDLMSKISTVAGAVSAVSGSTNGFKSFISKTGVQKSGAIATAVGTAMSTTGSLMAEFGESSQLTNMLSMVGSGISLAGSITTIASQNQAKADENDKTNSDSKEKMESVEEGGENNTDTKEQSKVEAEAKRDGTTTENGKSPDSLPNKPAPAEGAADVPPAEQQQQAKDMNEVKQIQQEGQKMETSTDTSTPDTSVSETSSTDGNKPLKGKPEKLNSELIKNPNAGKDILGKALQLTSTALNVAATIVGEKDTAQEDAKKIRRFHQLSKEAKEIMNKHKTRVASIANMRNDTQKR